MTECLGCFRVRAPGESGWAILGGVPGGCFHCPDCLKVFMERVGFLQIRADNLAVDAELAEEDLR